MTGIHKRCSQAKVIELAGYAKWFQVNTIRKRRVLSHFFLGKRAIMTHFQISKNDWRDGIKQLAQQLKKRKQGYA